ncbi:MAG: Rieske 2Fe-2S domain-containing protein [Actinomycetaceae bacterium]|nr:Rieske 2Fe-2S domain-containing protein [Actinomycetaceae bacterium]
MCTLGDIPSDEGIEVSVEIGGKPTRLALLRDDRDGSVHAISAMCTHGDVSLAEGEVSDGKVECWGHGATFDLYTGKESLPATSPVKVFDIQLDGEDVLVNVEAKA